MSVHCVVTTHNEGDNIRDFVRQLRRNHWPVIVVDEKSTDGTATEAIGGGAEVIEWSGGIGPCLVHGWKEALAHPDCSQILQIDAGGSHRVKDAHLLLYHAVDGLTVGGRFSTVAQYEGPALRQLGSRGYGKLWAAKTGHWGILDWTSGFRVFSRECAEYLAAQSYTATMHGWQAEVIAQALDAGFPVLEVPITYKVGASSLSHSVAREAFRAWKDYR